MNMMLLRLRLSNLDMMQIAMTLRGVTVNFLGSVLMVSLHRVVIQTIQPVIKIENQTVIQILILPAAIKGKTVLSMTQLVRQRAPISVVPWSQVSSVPPTKEIPPQSLKSQISPILARKTIKNGNPLSLLDLATQFALGMPFVMRHKV